MRVFLVKFAKFLRTPNLKNIRGRLFLPLQILQKYQDLTYFSRGKKKKILGPSFLAGWAIYLLFFYCVTMASDYCQNTVQKKLSKDVQQKRCS